MKTDQKNRLAAEDELNAVLIALQQLFDSEDGSQHWKDVLEKLQNNLKRQPEKVGDKFLQLIHGMGNMGDWVFDNHEANLTFMHQLNHGAVAASTLSDLSADYRNAIVARTAALSNGR